MRSTLYWFRILVLAFVMHYISIYICVQADVERVHINANKTNNDMSNATLETDSLLNASERSRRLITYMPFYFPASELPINKDYAVQKLHKKHHLLQTNDDLLLQIPNAPLKRIPIPPTYTQKVKVSPDPLTSTKQLKYKTFADSNSQLQANYQHNTGNGDIYQSLSTSNPEHLAFKQVQIKPELINMFSPTPALSPHNNDVTKNYIPYKPQSTIPRFHKYKTVQHFPPIRQEHTPTAIRQPSSPTISHQQHIQPPKVNLTPFTPQNILPGNFVPIIYKLLGSSENHLDAHYGDQHHQVENVNDQPNTAFNHKKPRPFQEQVIGKLFQEHQQPSQTHFSTSTPQSLSAPSAITTHGFSEPHLQSEEKLTSSAGAPSTASIYHTQRFKQTLLKYNAILPAYHAPKYENYSHLEAHALSSKLPVTPQEKYVLYLQQRLKYKNLEQQIPQKQTPVVFISSSTMRPIAIEKPKSVLTNNPNYGKQNSNGHVVYARPELPLQRHNYNPLIPQHQVMYTPLSINNFNEHEQRHRLQNMHKTESSSAPKAQQYIFEEQKQQQPLSHHIQQPPTYAITTVQPKLHQYHQQHFIKQPVSYIQQPMELQPTTNTATDHNYKEDIDLTREHGNNNNISIGTEPKIETGVTPQTMFSHPTDVEQLPDIHTSSLSEILHKLQSSNHLPKILTPDNIDNSIKTLILILQNLKQTQSIPQHQEIPTQLITSDYAEVTKNETSSQNAETNDEANMNIKNIKPNNYPGPSTGRPGIDYPNYATIPQTDFDCSEQRYKGFFGDPETDCQVWHYCDLNGGKSSFLCPNGTIFSQIALTCDWWFNVKCASTAQLYVLNERLYKYILPFTPKFPEDYSGPIVDKYLAMKFREMEEKMRLGKENTIKSNMNSKFKNTSIQIDDTNLEKYNSISTSSNASSTLPTKQDEQLKVNSPISEQSSERNLLIDDEADDISERGIFNSNQTFTTIQPITDSTEPLNTSEELLSLKPIVVSTQTLYDIQEEETVKNPQHFGSEVNPLQNSQTVQESTKVSVEKQEVIEIKSDDAKSQLSDSDENNKA